MTQGEEDLLAAFGRIARNPHRRLMTPEDVARCIVAICHPATYWMTGVDDGESMVG
jgi:hypothetical protein